MWPPDKGFAYPVAHGKSVKSKDTTKEDKDKTSEALKRNTKAYSNHTPTHHSSVISKGKKN